MSDLSSPHPSSNRRILRFALVGAGMLLQPCWIFAGGSGLSGLAEAEVQRRQTLIQDATGRIQEGHLLLEHEKFAEAVTAFSEAYSSLPEAPLTESARDAAREGFAAASVARARELAKEARYAEANQLLDAVLAPGMYPGYEAAVEFRKQLADPDRYPPALTPQHIEATQQVTHWLTMAQSHFELGDYDAANQDYLKVLRIDPTNTAARRGMEVVEQKKAEYYASARDQTRATMLNQVNRKWEDGIPPDLATTTALEQGRIASLKTEETRRDLLVQKLRTLVIPSVDFQGASLEEIMEFLRVRSRDVDPEGRGVDFILDVPLEIASRPIDLNVSNIPMDQLVRYIAEQAGARYRVEPFAVKITSLSEQSSEILTKRYKVPPNFIETSATDDAATSGNVDPFATNTTPAGGLTIRRLSAKEFLEGRGVTFPDGSGASYTAVTNQLIVRNTAANLEIVDMLVEQAAAASPKQARITVRMVEVDQTNMQEMGFDWLMGAFNVPGSDALYMSGGTAGNAEASGSPTENFPMSYPGGTGVAVGVNPMTAGLRSSGEIVGRPKLNDLLGENISPPVVNSRSPGTFALTGMLTDPQFQMVIRSLNQRKGVDFVAVPSIVTKGGQKATIELADEFIYPTEFDPPEIPQQVGTNIRRLTVVTPTGVSSSGASMSAPITPSTPTTFETRKVGTTIEMEPIISGDGREVELLITPKVTQFEGFIDYGSDIDNVMQMGDSQFNQPVDNRIIQPIFRTNTVTTGVKVYDGATVVLAGVKREDRINVKDKVPVIGDIPLVGRFWKSNVDRVQIKNFVVFVTVEVLDPAGQRINQAAGSGTEQAALSP